MIIHVVQPGETTNEIAKQYGISEERLILDNEIQNPDNLAVGETLVILIPQVTYTVQDGDTLSGIANLYGITVLQLLRNNPFLSSREFIYPGETIVISYESQKVGKLSTYGYANPYINTDVLLKTLPFLTYITVYSYTFNDAGNINDIDDEEIIELAKEYQVAPIMMLNPEDINHNSASNTMQNFLMSQESQELFFYNVLNILRSKGYYGVNLNVPYILPQNRDNFVDFMIRFSHLLKNEGFTIVFDTLSLSAFEIMTGIVYEGFDYSKLIQNVDGLFLMTYEWGNYIGIPTGIISFDNIRQYVSEMAERFPAEKMYIGIPILGYMWELPFILGVSRGIAITSNAAVELSKDMGAVIQYDDISKTAYFQYILDREYVVRFRDTRSIKEYLELVNEFGLNGISIWNIMQFYPQLWLVVNSLYDINNVYEDKENS
jgi:spore germination protein